ncbi:MAG: glycoside hydrolase family 127 protein, partial [Steroidobacteraceae bacterium]
MRTAFLVLLMVPLATDAAAPDVEIERFELADVHLYESPFTRARDRNAAYLLSLDADRLLHNTRKYAGLEPKGSLYGGWESQGIAGHTLGHYLTALSLQFAASGDRRFRERIDYIVTEMATAQRAYGDGYVGALPPRELETLRGLKEGKVAPKDGFFFQNGAWVPWYTQHKILAGLRDAWLLAGNLQAKEVALRLADWVDAVTAPLSDAQLQTMLQVEQGGMVEVLVDLHAATGEERYLNVARRFEHRAVLEPLRSERDELAGKHANTQIPKITGAARKYEVAGDPRDRVAAEQFWRRVVQEHSWVIGGNSDKESFFEPHTAAQHLTAATAETCNTYNMLKLTEHLFAWRPQVEYADYYERALYNHILASQEPGQGMFTYFMSLQPGHFRTYSTPHESFWCCVGSGMENHTKYGSAIYFHDDDDLYVNLFIPSVVAWREKKFVLEQTTDYPTVGATRFTIKSSRSAAVTLQVRAPAWAAGALTVKINGKPISVDGSPGRYVPIERKWQRGDTVDVEIPMAVRTEALRGTTDEVA